MDLGKTKNRRHSLNYQIQHFFLCLWSQETLWTLQVLRTYQQSQKLLVLEPNHQSQGIFLACQLPQIFLYPSKSRRQNLLPIGPAMVVLNLKEVLGINWGTEGRSQETCFEVLGWESWRQKKPVCIHFSGFEEGRNWSQTQLLPDQRRRNVELREDLWQHWGPFWQQMERRREHVHGGRSVVGERRRLGVGRRVGRWWIRRGGGDRRA